MIQIVSQDGVNQYDDSGNAITTWNAKACNWIVNPEFEKEKIDWWGVDNDFPRGTTWGSFIANNPNWDKKPDIVVTWYWNDKESCIKTFGQPKTFQSPQNYNPRYWEDMKYPYSATKDWGYLDYSEEEAIIQCGKYCNFNKHAQRVTISYNGKILHDDILY